MENMRHMNIEDQVLNDDTVNNILLQVRVSESESKIKYEDNNSILQDHNLESCADPTSIITDIRTDVTSFFTEKSADKCISLGEVFQEDEAGRGTDADCCVVELNNIERKSSQDVISSMPEDRESDVTGESLRCSICQQSFKTTRKLIMHEQREHIKEKGHHCTECDKSFSFKLHLARHIFREHSNKIYKCRRCEFQSDKKEILTSHYSDKHPKQIYQKCPHCGSCFHQVLFLTLHMRSVHKHDNFLVCRQCDYECLRSGDLEEHKKTVHGHKKTVRDRNNNCTKCPYNGSTKSDLRRHWIAAHYNNPMPYSCSLCCKAFDGSADHSTHIVAVHKGLSSVSCGVCSHKFSMKWDLLKHIDALHPECKRRVCPICYRSLLNNWQVNRHIKDIHNGGKPFECKHCSKSFPRKEHYIKHMKVEHK